MKKAFLRYSLLGLLLMHLFIGCSQDSDAPDNTTQPPAADTEAPIVAITAPAQFEFVGDTVEIKVEVLDDSPIREVVLLIDGDSVAADQSAPYRFQWIFTDENDAHTLFARAVDAEGNQGLSQLITVYSILDVTAPVVFITYPADDSFVSGDVLIRAEAGDNLGVARVTFFVDGDSLATDTEAPYEVLWSVDPTEEAHTLYATAEDGQGNVGVSQLVTVYSDSLDLSPPVVVITAPINLATVSDTVQVMTQAVDNREVTRVEFFVDGELSATVTTAPFNWQWDTTGEDNGFHTLLAKAYDAAGNAGISQLVNVNVQN